MTNSEATDRVNALFGEWYRPLLRYAVRLSGSLPAAEDFVQEAFLSYYRALVDCREVECPKAYTMAAIRHQAQHAWAQKRRGRTPGSIDDLAGSLAIPDDEERTIIWDDLQRLIAELTPREVEVLLLRAEALTYREIGEELGIATTSVGTLLARALKKLQALTANTSTRRGPSDEAATPERPGPGVAGKSADTEEGGRSDHENPSSSGLR